MIHSTIFTLEHLYFNFIFYLDLSLDAMDSAGDQHLHIDHNIYKRRVDLQGNPIEEAKKEEISTSTKNKNENVSLERDKSLNFMFYNVLNF